MARSRDLLDRFRPAGAPGAAASAGVPADRYVELSAELGPVLSALADTTTEAARIRHEGRRVAEERRRAALDEAQVPLEAARRDVEAERADAAARLVARTEQESAATRAEAGREADEIRQQAAANIPAFVEDVVATLRDTMREDRP